VNDFIPLARALWDEYGREGRVAAAIPLGMMELAEPETVIPLLMELCRTCITREDADRLAMDALDPIVRKQPERWLSAIEPWLVHENKWVRRTGVLAIGRLPMRHPTYTARCLELTKRLLLDEEGDVKKAVGFAIRLAAREGIAPVRDFLCASCPSRKPSCDVGTVRRDPQHDEEVPAGVPAAIAALR